MLINESLPFAADKKNIKKYSDRIKKFWLQLKVHWRLDINKNKAFHSKNAKTKGTGMFFPPLHNALQ